MYGETHNDILASRFTKWFSGIDDTVERKFWSASYEGVASAGVKVWRLINSCSSSSSSSSIFSHSICPLKFLQYNFVCRFRENHTCQIVRYSSWWHIFIKSFIIEVPYSSYILDHWNRCHLLEQILFSSSSSV
ncbi:hypothetical protein C0J52_25279 [Blattella germanica]|nr:hypothetical protein C0J52_25279 [Blattella germanica]